MSSDSEPDFDDPRFLQVNSLPDVELSYAERRRKQLARQFDQSRSGGKRTRDQREREAREEGLSTSLLHKNEDSKAAKMMRSMGFKVGDKLGRSSPTDQRQPSGDHTTSTHEHGTSSAAEPISINMRKGKGGLGHASAQTDKAADETKRQATARQSKADDQTRASFREHASEVTQAQRATKLLKPAIRTCRDLDLRSGKTTSVMWVDPTGAEHEPSNEPPDGYSSTVVPLDDEYELPADDDITSSRASWSAAQPAQQLDAILDYLRREYAYCFWCGCQYTNAQDLLESCPGPDENAH